MDTPIGTSAGRQKTLQALEEQTELTPIDEPDGINDLIDAVNAIAVPRVLSPPQKTVEQIDEIHTALLDEAQPHYVGDDRLLRHINAARRQFNDWMGKRRRMAEMPSPVETGWANYPTRRAQKRSRREDEAREELEAKLDRVQSTARGAEQRALNAIGSSVGEQTEQRREQRRNELREQLAEGAIVKFRNPELRAGRVVRVNTKSVRVRYPNPRAGSTCPITGEEEPDEREDRIQLDSEYLEQLDAETINDAADVLDGL
ncbi:hypothetical protein KVP04_01640 [Halobacterium salinarum]|uniref:hypothetical protein n=1 Tax=Halobacterium salinarum TaxID=2242 RepID=UPI001F2631C7|nr:hypothetical protein [Halobacterium salinarum]MCF2237832.1 hypothetical protein [Halobacterium salinarum]